VWRLVRWKVKGIRFLRTHCSGSSEIPRMCDPSLWPLNSRKIRMKILADIFVGFLWLLPNRRCKETDSCSWRVSKGIMRIFRDALFSSFFIFIEPKCSYLRKYGKLTQAVTQPRRCLSRTWDGKLTVLTGFCWFSSVSPGKCEDSNSNKSTTDTLLLLSFVIQYHPINGRYRVWITDSVAK
jgi:hypothetical protein